MKYLFAETGLQVLESLSFTRTLYAFDFDGTLAPIVADPELAGISSETLRLLNELAHLVPVAVISGRSIADLRTRISLHGNLLIGNHGVEGLGVKRDAISSSEEICRKWVLQLDEGWGDLSEDSGTFVENKTYSLAAHYRKSRNKRKSKAKLFLLIKDLDPAPRVVLGKSVVNLVPSGGPHKGMALVEAMKMLELSSAFYIGDDDTDEDVFSLPDSRVISSRVGFKRSSQAQFYLKRQNEINKLLRVLIRMTRKCKSEI